MGYGKNGTLYVNDEPIGNIGKTEELQPIDSPSGTRNIFTYEHKGYTLHQTSYNWHYMIVKDGRWVVHCPCTHKLTEQEAKKAIDAYLKLKEVINV